jgi:hypothetical protein
LHVLSYALNYLNHIPDRRDVSLALEVEIVKSIKAIVNTKIGGKEAMHHPEYIHTIVFSILCPQWQTRKMVCEFLTFICYMDGYEHVVQGFELLRKHRKDFGLFDAWMDELEDIVRQSTLDEKLTDSHLLDYCVSVFLFA